VEPPERIVRRIFVVRGKRVMLDADLAELYGVPTRRLNEQVRRNSRRFPPEFTFALTYQEVTDLKSQFATSSWGGKRKLPLAFTEHGAIMAATVLNSPRAIEVSVFVVRAFLQLREALASNRELTRRLDDLERRVGTHDRAIGEILAAIRQLASPPDPPPKRRIGFVQG
jgi:hypothetical protein